MNVVPVVVRRSKPCNRCGLRYPKKETECVHCAHLSDRELERFKEEIQDSHVWKAAFGKFLLYLAALSLFVFFVASLG